MEVKNETGRVHQKRKVSETKENLKYIKNREVPTIRKG